METILIIEDDAVMLRGLKDNFEFKGYGVLTAADGEEGLNTALNKKPDLILLDIMLPKINGYEVCRLIRQEQLEMPIIMLTAKGQESDIVLGLNLGADDYVTKPFSIKELLARAAAFLRRGKQAEENVYEFADYRLDIGARTLTHHGNEVKLSPKEFNLLQFFVKKHIATPKISFRILRVHHIYFLKIGTMACITVKLGIYKVFSKGHPIRGRRGIYGSFRIGKGFKCSP